MKFQRDGGKEEEEAEVPKKRFEEEEGDSLVGRGEQIEERRNRYKKGEGEAVAEWAEPA